MKGLEMAFVLVGITGLICLWGGQANAQPAERIFALVLTGSGTSGKQGAVFMHGSQEERLDARVVELLQAEGIHLVTRPVTEPLGQEILRQFHLVIVLELESLKQPPLWDVEGISGYYTVRRNLAELKKYVESGGGLFVSPGYHTAGIAKAQSLEPLLGPWGVSLVAACPQDEAHRWENYSWTENVADSPVSQGVKRLYYPVLQGRWDDVYATLSLSLHDERWKPVVRGMPGSVAARCHRYTGVTHDVWHPISQMQEEPPVLAAIAEIGRGRAALLSIHRYFTFTFAYYPEVPPIEFRSGKIDGIVWEKGDGTTPSDGGRLIVNTFRWLAEPAAKQGWGTYTPESYAALPTPPKAPCPAWMTGWNEGTGATFYRVLIGARSARSEGQGTVADYVDAARQAGYSILVITEDLKSFPPEKWDEFRKECVQASANDLVVVPGLDIQDGFGNRYLVWGRQMTFPAPWMLTDDGRAMTEVQYLMIGLGNAFSAIARPGSTPLPHHLYKHFAGLVVYTYREGKLVDNGMPAYQVQVYNMSLPVPLVVHEVYAPEEVEQAAGGGHQLYVPADTVENAAWYLEMGGLQHYYESPGRFLVTGGPMIRSLDAGKGHGSYTNFTVEGEAPITEIRYYANYELLRRWTPNAKRFSGQVTLWPGRRYWGFLWIKDAEGRTAISPALRTGRGHGFDWRCADRQNFFATAVAYTGTFFGRTIDVWLPTFGTDEGKGLWPYWNGPRRGENMCPLLEFPYFSPAVTITDAYLDQRYWNVSLFEQVGFDARPPQATTRSRVYEGRLRYHDLHTTRPMMLMEIELRLRLPVVPSGDVFPGFVKVGTRPFCRFQDEGGAWVTERLSEGYVDLPLGGSANDLVALTPGLRVNAEGLVGFAPPAGWYGSLPTGYSWKARWVRVGEGLDVDEARRAMGLAGDVPFALELKRGRMESLAYVAYLNADDFGVAGEVRPYAEMPYQLPLRIAGLNGNWPTGLWRPGTEDDLVPFGVFEEGGWALLDVKRGGPFYAGNLLIADDVRLRMSIINWTADGILIEVNNPTDGPLEAVVRTPAEITNRYRLRETISLEPGTSVRLRFPK